ncbi:MAG: hypothetical protein NT015_08730 [Alphaproteobacteria bacterium]|nr:hypothetical protein [Alphaproteobacteria bacterium]
MKTFLAVFTGNTAAHERSGWDTLSATDRKAREQKGIAAWGAWVATNQASIVENGSPLGKTKRTGLNGVTDIKNNLAAYLVVRAETHEAAAKLFEDHPHFTIFPGEAVEIMECLPIPGM